jgi:hypothetical protein
MTDAIERLPRPGDPPRGQTHPTGGYDTVVFDRARGEYRCLLGGQPHRLDGPAVQGPHESRYYRHGALHRTNGPAVVRRSGHNSYYLEGHDCGMHFAAIMAEVITLAPRLAIGVPAAYRAYVSGLHNADDIALLHAILPRHATLDGAIREVKASTSHR